MRIESRVYFIIVIRFVYSTFSSLEEAERVVQVLLEERRIACANVIPSIISYYQWEGALQNNIEVAVLFKTTAALTQCVMTRIQELHSYKCPCIASLSPDQVVVAFSTWVEDEVMPVGVPSP